MTDPADITITDPDDAGPDHTDKDSSRLRRVPGTGARKGLTTDEAFNSAREVISAREAMSARDSVGETAALQQPRTSELRNQPSMTKEPRNSPFRGVPLSKTKSMRSLAMEKKGGENGEEKKEEDIS